ncbi:MAG: hypothetical protein EBS05_16620, partial [Proteobacteria bacterium]|nr:hypothetical protein [Pseudomonadota bacterium]
VRPGYRSANQVSLPLAGFDRSDKLAQPNVFPRADIRKRSNFARVKGGASRGPGNIEFTQPKYTIDESAGSLFITLHRTNGTIAGEVFPVGAASVNFSTIDLPFGPGAATAGSDYVTTRLVPTWTFGGARASDGNTGPNNLLRGQTDVFVTVQGDSLVEGDESISLVLSQPQSQLFLAGERMPTGAALGVAAATMTIVDDDFNYGVLTFPQTVFRVDEGVGTAVVTVIRTNGSSGPVSCDYLTSVVGSTATVGLDYVATSGSIAFASGQLTNTFSVTIIDDSLVELDEIIAIQLMNPRGGATLGLTNAAILIIDNDFAAGRLSFSQTNYSVSESGGTAVITVQRSGGSQGAVTVQATVTGGTAVAPADFLAATNVLTWANGESASKTFSVAVVDNQVVDGNRTVNLALINPSIAGAVGAVSNSVLTIVDDDAFGTVSFSESAYNVNENGGQAIITVVRLGGVAGTVSVRFDTVVLGSTAVAGRDYVATNGFLTMAPGQTSSSFRVAVIDNAIQDGTRTVNLLLSNPTNATLVFPTTAVLSIIDDESVNTPAGSLDTTYTSSGADNAIYALALQLDGNLLLGGDFTVVNGVSRNRLARLDGTGALDPQFNLGGADGSIRSLIFYYHGFNTGRILVAGFFTEISGTNRSRIARLNQSGSVDLTFDPGAGTDNAIYSVALQPDDKVVIGGGFSTFNGIGRNFIARLNENGTLDNTFDPGTGANGPVYAVAVQADGKVLIGGDFTTVNGIALTNLARLNGDGSVDTSFNTGSGANSTVRSLIVQTDGRILMAGSFTNYAGTAVGRVARLETTGALDSTFNPGGVGADNAVFYMTVQRDGKMLLGGDFTRFNGVSRNRFTRLNPDGTTDPTINVGTGANNFIAAIALQADDKIVVAGGFTTFNSQPRNYLARLNGGLIAGSGSLEFTSANYYVAENAGAGTIIVRRVGGTTGAASVYFSTSDGTATTNGIHYTNVSATLNFPEGETFVATNISVVDDQIVNGDRFVNMTLSNFIGAAPGGQTNALLTIVNDDARIGFSAATYNVSEAVPSGNVTISVLRTGGTLGQVAVQFATTTNGTAAPNQRFTPVSGTLVFAVGETNKTFSVPIINDNILNGNQTIELVLTNLTGSAVAGQVTAVVTIIDDDVAPGVFNFSQGNYITNASDTIVQAQIVVTRSNGSSGVVSVGYRTGNGTGIAGLDYLATSGTLSFADGETVKTFYVPVLPDLVHGTNETVFLDLFNPTGGAVIGFQNSAILTILNNDILIYGNLVFSSATYTNREDDGAAVITVRRIGGTTGSISVTYATTNTGTATPGFHYTPVTGTLTWAEGDGSPHTFVIPLFNNNIVDGNRTVDMLLFNPTGGSSLNIPSAASLTILDKDSAPGVLGFSTLLFNVSESASNALITVTRTNGFTGSVSVRYATFTNGNDSAVAYSGGVVLPGVHSYTNTTGTLTFTNGVTNQTFYVPVIDNSLQDGNRTFSIRLFGESGGALLGLSNAVVRIVDNENAAGSVDFGYITGSGADGTVFSILVATNGQAILAGDFHSFNGTALQNVARINVDGTVDNAFNPATFTYLSTNSVGILTRAVANTNEVTITTANPHGFGAGANLTIAGLDRTFMNGAAFTVASVLSSTSFTYNAAFSSQVAAVSRANASSTATITTVGPHQFQVGDTVSINVTTNTSFNGLFAVTAVPNNNSFVYSQAGTNVGPAVADAGTVTLAAVPRAGVPGTASTVINAAKVRGIGAYTNGVNANKVVVGGLFNQVGIAARGNVARLNPDGTLDTTFNTGAGVNNAVNSVAIQNNGRVVVGGAFTAVDNTNRSFVARLNFDGSLDTTFDPGSGPNAQVRVVLPLNDGRILIAGDFDSVSGVPNRRIARLNPDGTADVSFVSGGMITNGSIYAMALQINGQILIGGTFAATNGVGVSRFNLARLNQDGTLDASFDPGAGPDDLVTVVTIQSDGKILAGGAFKNFAGYSRNRLVRLDGTGKVDPTINIGTGADNLVAAVALQNDGKILVGGAFTTFNGVPQNRYTRLNGGQNYGSGLVSFSASTFVVSEAGTNAVISVIRTGGTSNQVSVDYSIASGGTAVAGVDYLPVGGTLFFAQGETLRSFVVPVVDDTLVKPDRTVFLTLSNITGGASLDIPPTATLFIQENDSFVGFASSAFSVAENGTNALVTVVRSGGTNELVTVDYYTAGLTAVPIQDYNDVAGSLTFLPGVSTQTFLVPIIDDGFVDGNETVGLYLTNAGPIGIGAVGSLSNAVLTIIETHFGVGVLGFAATNFSALESAGVAVITVTRTNGNSGAVSVNFTTVDGVGTATAGVRYQGTNGILTFGDGETTKFFNVPLIDDDIVNGNQTVALGLFNPTGGVALGLTNSVLTILDDDSFGTFQFSTNSYSVVESAGGVTVTVLRTGGAVGAVSVTLVTAGGTANSGSDYVPVSQVMQFAAGQRSSNVTVQIINNTIVQPTRTINLILTGPTGNAVLGTITNTTISIIDDDMQFSFTATNYTVVEDAGTAVVTVSRYGLTNLVGSVTYATSDGTAVNGIDYLGVTNTLVFLPGVTTTNFSVTVKDNQILQFNRILNLTLANATSTSNSIVTTNNTSLGTNSTATLTILDNDNIFSFSAANYTVVESAGQLIVPVLRFGQNTGNVSVVCSAVALTGPLAAPPGGRFNLISTNLTFGPGQSNANFNIPILNDLIPQGNQIFGLTMANPLPVGAAQLGVTNTATVTIVDDDIGIGFSAANYTVSETSGSVTIGINRAGVTNVSVSVAFATTNGTAVPGVRYLSTNAVFTFAAGVTNRTFTVAVLDDHVIEPPQTVNLVLSNPTGGAFLTVSNAVLTILDSVGSVGFTATNFLVSEAGTNGIVTVARSGGSSGAVSVRYFTLGSGTATSGLDYADVSGTLSWNDGETGAKSFLVPVFNDQLVEPTETVALWLTNVLGGASLGTSNATLSIVDDDGPGGVEFGFDPGPGFDSSVYAVVQQTNGQLVAAGRFTAFNGTSRARLARLNIDGSLDASFNQGLGPDNSVNALALLPDGRVVIAGDFTSVGGSLRSRVARLLADGTLDTSFSVGTGANNSVNTLALQPDGKTLIGGNFTNFNGTARGRIARLNTSGSLDTSFAPGTGANGIVFGIAVYPPGTNSGKVLVVGSFTTFNGVTVNRLVRLNADGSQDTTFNPGTGANSTVATVSLQPDGKILVGGLFSSINGVSRSRLARLNADGSLDLAFFPVMNDTVLSLAVQPDGRIVAGGAFTSVNGDTGVPPAPGIGVTLKQRTANVATLTTSGGHGMAIGSRVNIAGVGVGFDGAITVTAIGSPTTFSYASPGADVVATAVTPAGSFLAAGTPASRITRLLADGSLDASFVTGAGADNLVYTVLLQSDLKVVLAGDFTTVNNAVRGHIARLNGSSNTLIPTILGSAGFSGGQFVISVSGEPGRAYRIDYSTDLHTWNVLATVNSGYGVVNFTDPASAGGVHRYYRVIQLP